MKYKCSIDYIANDIKGRHKAHIVLEQQDTIFQQKITKKLQEKK